VYTEAAKLIRENKEVLASQVSNWVKENYPDRTNEYDKCARDMSYILKSLAYCLDDGDRTAIESLSRMFFTRGVLQLKSVGVEFEAYDFIVEEIENLFKSHNIDPKAILHVKHVFVDFKQYLLNGQASNHDTMPRNVDRETRIKHILYGWDDEKYIMKGMQQCQRNWDLSINIPQEAIDYLTWIAKNAPSKQHEAYYDVYWSTDRDTIDYLYQFTWGSTHRKNPPAMWRNSQMNANLYMIFVCKQPPTMFNCNNDGTLQDAFGESRWENSIVSVGMAMGLVMRAAHKMGLKTGPNKVKDLGPDYDFEWEKALGIYDDVKAGTKRLFFGLGIGMPNQGRPRWESDDTEFAIGASNGHHVSTKWKDEDWDPLTPGGKEKRKIDIVDIREYGGQTLTDPYGNEQEIPTCHEIKINTVYERDIKVIEVPKIKK
jgi:hypothetical protein